MHAIGCFMCAFPHIGGRRDDAYHRVLPAGVFARMLMNSVLDQDALRTGLLMAAGSLRAVMEVMLSAHLRAGGAAFETVYGPSEKLRQSIAEGRTPDVFASASLAHLEMLAPRRLLGPSSVFARNALCVVARPELHFDATKFAECLCDPAVRLATSTPGSDPMGDYTWQLFRNIGRQRPGAFEQLSQNARQLSGADIPAANERSPYIAAFEEDRADAYVMYRTNAMLVKQAMPQLQLIPVPDAYNVHCAYGIAAAMESSIGRHFVSFVLSPAGRKILTQHGFEMP